MEKQVLFRDRQELQAGDLNDIQTFTRATFDDLIKDAVTDKARYTGFTTSQASATEIAIATGRLYDQGRLYLREEITQKDFLADLPVANQRWISVVAFGETIETQVEPRDFLIDLDAGTTEPQAVPMQESRRAQLDFVVGSAAISPVKPAVPAGTTRIADVLLDPTQILRIEQAQETRLPSVRGNAQAIGALDVFRQRATSRVDSLANTLTEIAQKTRNKADLDMVTGLRRDLAQLRREAGLPAGVTAWAFDDFRDDSRSDPAHPDYDAEVDEVLTFPAGGTATFALQLFDPNDPNAHVTPDNWLFPAFGNQPVMAVDSGFNGEVALSSFTIETTETRRIQTYKTVTRTGRRPKKIRLLNYNQFQGRDKVFLETTDIQHGEAVYDKWGDRLDLKRQIIYETYTYSERVPTTRTVTDTVQEIINGATLAQTFVAPRNAWITRLGLRFTELDSSGDVRVLITHAPDGKPNQDTVLSTTTIPFEDLKSGRQETLVDLSPAFLDSGERYAVWLITSAGHKIATSDDVDQFDGLLMHKADGRWQEQTSTAAAMVTFYAPRFPRPRQEIRLNEVSLTGGISDIEIATEQDVRGGTHLLYEARINGLWQKLSSLSELVSQSPDLIPLRAVFVGSRNMMPALQLGPDRVVVTATANSFTHVSSPRQLPAASADITVEVIAGLWQDSEHSLSCELIDNTNAATLTAASHTVADLLDELPGNLTRVRHVFRFTPATATADYNIKLLGTTTATAQPFNVLERLDYAL